MSTYPITEQKSLPKAPRRGLWGLGSRSRLATELPLPRAHEVLVYKSNGVYVVDNGHSRLDDEYVASATNVSVVDMRDDAPVTVAISIPSSAAIDFVVRVTFLCTVKKPEDVVAAGIFNMESALAHYLMRHQPLFHIGAERDLDDLHRVRREVTAEVKAYVAVRPPQFRGVDVDLGSVQVLAPEELAVFERQRRERRREEILIFEGQRQTQELELDVLSFEQARNQRRLEIEQELRSTVFAHVIGETNRLREAIGADHSEIPILMAAAAGERTIAEIADMLSKDRQQRIDTDAADSLRRATWEREVAQDRWRAEREDARLRFNLKVEEIKAQLEVFSAGIARGLADHSTIDNLVDVISGAVRELDRAASNVPAISAGDNQPYHTDSYYIDEPVAVDDEDGDHTTGGLTSEDSPSSGLEERTLAEVKGAEPDQPAGRGSDSDGVAQVHESGRNDGTSGDTSTLPDVDPIDHFFVADCPANTCAGDTFSLLARITRSKPARHHAAAERMKPFEIAGSGTRITIIVQHPVGLRALTPLEQVVFVPQHGDSDPARFAFQADQTGLARLWVTAFSGGTCLGELVVEVSVDAIAKNPEHVVTISTDLESLRADPGEVTMQVRFDGARYSFQLLSDSYFFEPVLAEALTTEPGEAAGRAIAALSAMAAGRSEYRRQNARTWMQETGIGLWADMVPRLIQDQFWQLRPHITSFSIASGRDIVPWELLYPLSPSDDAGFLVEQFPVLRRAYGQRRCRHLTLDPALWVIPPDSPINATQEVAAIRARISGSTGDEIADLETLIGRINDGKAGLLHFACHNSFNIDSGGSSIRMQGGSFVPTLLNRAVTTRALIHRSPLVFINACRSAGDAPQYTKLLGWAGQFMAAGAGAFLGTLWAVPSDSAQVFAESFYDALTGTGGSLGLAMKEARLQTARAVEDPTWLAYTLFGDPKATVSTIRLAEPGDHCEG